MSKVVKCSKCGKTLAVLENGSKVIKEFIYCQNCYEDSSVDVLRGFMGMK